MSPRTLTLQNQIRSTTSGIEYDDTMQLSLAENIVNAAFIDDVTQVSGTMVMDLNFLRTAVRDIKGATPTYNWFDPASTLTTASLIDLSQARAYITNIRTFIGSDTDIDTTPDYSSTCFVGLNDPLETAIGKLDAALCVATGTTAAAQEIQKRILIRTGSQVAENTTIDIQSPGAGWSVFGDAIVIPTSGTFVENVQAFTNGVLQLNGPDSAANHDVYFVASGTSIAYEYKIRTNDVLQFLKFPPFNV